MGSLQAEAVVSTSLWGGRLPPPLSLGCELFLLSLEALWAPKEGWCLARSLRPGEGPRARPVGVQGELRALLGCVWGLHAGGFLRWCRPVLTAEPWAGASRVGGSESRM